MSQYDWVNLNGAADGGTTLVTRLNGLIAAVQSGHRGSGEPSYVEAGMIWSKTVSGTVEEIYYYDGAQSVLLATVNPTAHTVLFPAAGLPVATDSAQGASELSTTAEQLTGTAINRASTPDSVAALWERGADNTGGATITLGDGGSFNLITSTTAITILGYTTDKSGRPARIRFNTIRTLTHNASSLILPGGANIVTAVGDICEIESIGSGNFRVNWYTRADGTPLVGGGIPVLFNYLAGLTMSNNVATPNSKIDVAAGQAADSNNADMIDFAGGTLDLGTTGANGLRTGALVANTNYAVFVIKGTSGVALFADTSITPGTRPAGYTAAWRRVGTFRTDGSTPGHVLPFIQTGRIFRRKTLTTSVSGAAMTGSSADYTLDLPTGKKWPVELNGSLITSGAFVLYAYFRDPDSTSQTISATNAAPLAQLNVATATNGAVAMASFSAITNTSSQVSGIANNFGTVSLVVGSWFDDALP